MFYDLQQYAILTKPFMKHTPVYVDKVHTNEEIEKLIDELNFDKFSLAQLHKIHKGIQYLKSINFASGFSIGVNTDIEYNKALDLICEMLITNDLCDNIKLHAREKALYDCVQTARRKIILMDCDAGYTIQSLPAEYNGNIVIAYGQNYRQAVYANFSPVMFALKLLPETNETKLAKITVFCDSLKCPIKNDCDIKALTDITYSQLRDYALAQIMNMQDNSPKTISLQDLIDKITV